MPWAVAAAAVAAGGAIYASNKQSGAAKDAANAQTSAADSASQTQLDMFNQSRADQAPFRDAGLVGLNQYMQMLGLGGNAAGQQYTGSGTGGTVNPQDLVTMQNGVPSMNAQLYSSDPNYKKAWDQAVAEHQGQFGVGYQTDSSESAIQNRLMQLYTPSTSNASNGVGNAGYETATPYNSSTGSTGGATNQGQADAFAAFRATPGYQFGLDEGNKSVQASAAARGGLDSGATLKALQQFGNNYADQQGYTPYMNKLASLAGMAQTSTNTTGALGANTANQVSANTIGAGQARAGGIYGSANAWANGAQQLAGVAGQALGSQGFGYGSSSGYSTGSASSGMGDPTGLGGGW